MVITSYKCDFCGTEYKENRERCYILGYYDNNKNFKIRDMCDECRKKMLKFIVDLHKE